VTKEEDIMTRFNTRVSLGLLAAGVLGTGFAGASPPPPVDPVPCEAWARAIATNIGGIIDNAQTLIDSYSSALGPYGGANVGSNAIVQTATTLTNNGGGVHGKVIAKSPAGLAVVPVPPGAKNLPLGSSSPGSLNINDANGSITLAPGDYVAANINVNFPGSLRVSPAGQARIWVTGTLNLGGNENQNGIPTNLAFLVTSSATVNVNSRGSLFGVIYAPIASVNVNSTIFGSVVGGAVTLNSGAAVHFDSSSRCNPTTSRGAPPPPLASAPPRVLPLPPTTAGCFAGTANGWVAIPCASPSVAGRYNITLEDEIDTPNGTSSTIPFQFAEVEATLTAFGSESDSAQGSNRFSLQGNSSFFPGNNGHQDWVQFVLDSGDTQSLLLIQSWDITLGVPTTDPPLVFANRTGANRYNQYDFGTIAGTVFNDSLNHPMIGVVAQVSWYDTTNDPMNHRGLYSVVEPDHFGLAGNWTGFSGTIVGESGGSTANFMNSSVLTRTLAGSCVNGTGPVSGIPWPGTCSGSPSLLPDTTLHQVDGTGENNNLCYVGNSAPLAAANTNLVFSQNLQSTSCSPTPVCIPNSSHVFVRSTDEDTGSRPINFGTEPFWESPDLFIVPTGQAITVDSEAQDINLTPGQTYDAYVRVHNDFGCSDVTNVQTRVFLADPTMLSTPWLAGEITSGNFAPPAGITVPAGKPGLLGPFTFMAPTTGFGDGHRCVLADVIANGEPAPADLFAPLASYQVAQRNLQFDCSYQLTNGTASNGNLQLALEVQTVDPPPTAPVVPSLTGAPVATVTFDDPGAVWAGVWSAQAGAGTLFTVTSSAGTTTVRLGQRAVALAAVPMPAGAAHAANPTLSGLPSGVTARFSLSALLSDAVSGATLVANGGSCQSTGVTPPPIR
jgi:hypothetical protein